MPGLPSRFNQNALNPQMNRRDLTRSKLWCGQRQDVRPGCVWKTRTWSNLFVGCYNRCS
jgi:hypothetical protein